jgi:tRNA pseudouridine synthase 10
LEQQYLEKLREVAQSPIILQQQTPVRVSHRRADKIREKTIYRFEIEELVSDKKHLIMTIEAQGGAYIKEFISGDEGRTTPSISELINQPVVCIALDVIKVDDKGLFNLA